MEKNYHIPACVDESGLHLTLVDDPTPPDVIDDAVDDVIETVLDKGGDVVCRQRRARQPRRITLILGY